MDLVSKLRRKDAGAFAPGHRTAQLPAFLPKVQEGKHHQRPKLSCYKNQSSAGRKAERTDPAAPFGTAEEHIP